MKKDEAGRDIEGVRVFKMEDVSQPSTILSLFYWLVFGVLNLKNSPNN